MASSFKINRKFIPIIDYLYQLKLIDIVRLACSVLKRAHPSLAIYFNLVLVVR